MDLLIEPRIDEVEMPENLAVSMQVMQQRMACKQQGCDFEIAAPIVDVRAETRTVS